MLAASGSGVALTAGMLKLVANVGSAICGMVNAGAEAGGGVGAECVACDSASGAGVGVTAGMLKLVANVGSAMEGTPIPDGADPAPGSGWGLTAGMLKLVAKVGSAI